MVVIGGRELSMFRLGEANDEKREIKLKVLLVRSGVEFARSLAQFRWSLCCSVRFMSLALP